MSWEWCEVLGEDFSRRGSGTWVAGTASGLKFMTALMATLNTHALTWYVEVMQARAHLDSDYGWGQEKYSWTKY